MAAAVIMSKPEALPVFSALSEVQSQMLNENYLTSQSVSDWAIRKFAADVGGTGSSPVSLPLFFEYLREGRSPQQVLEILLQFYCEQVPKEASAAAAYRHFRAAKRPLAEASKPKSKRGKRR